MQNFISNTGAETLKKRLIELISKSQELRFLVGFFYFSGIRELYEGLKNNPDVSLKVLVGLSVDVQNYGLVEYAEKEQFSDEEKAHKFFDSIKKSLNTENFDTKEFYEQIIYFIKLINENKLIIRKTFEPNHSKLYIFKLDESQVGKRNLFITGSSNLTKAGISTQNEFNVEIGDYGVEEASQYFESLWEKAVKISEFEDLKKKLIEVIEKETLVKEISPFEAFCLVLKTYLDSFEQKEIGESLIKVLEENNYIPYQYQLDAVRQSLSIIEENNGVIIADVVGLGKTIIACSIAKEIGKRGVIICPPGLLGDNKKSSGWKKYLEEFKLYDWEAWSLGDLKNAGEFVKKTKDVEVVIVDEAHRFRNQDTKDYELLKNICRGKKVILLTATPFNNRPGDILSLLKLFIIPKKSNITLENNLVDQFKIFRGMFDRLAYIKKYYNSIDNIKKNKAISYYKAIFEGNVIDLKKVSQKIKYLSRQIKNVIEPVTIRRNRLDLLRNPNYKKEIKELSKIADPKEWFFELSKEQSEFYEEIVGSYFGEIEESGRFKGAIYRPFEYEKELKEEKNEDDNRQFTQQRNLFDFMRRMIVKRFESSFGSFEQSIKNFEKITRDVKEFIEKTNEYILDRALLEKIYTLNEDEIEKYLVEYEEKIKKGEYPKNHKRYKLANFKFKEKFLVDIESDLELFREILGKIKELNLAENDPKAVCLIENIKKIFSEKPKNGEPKRKIVIFSEYVDTVLHLEKYLEKEFGSKLLIVAGDLSTKKIETINKNFDASLENQENEIDILLASDKISEGFNLNRAGMIINYDIPWNPVRVIQRVGRINRISKKVFEELFIVNFFPTEKGAELIRSREIASNKMFLIHNTLGEDAKIFDGEEEPTPAGLYQQLQKNPEKMEEESFYTKILAEFEKIKTENPDLMEKLKDYPPMIKVSKNGKENELLVFFKKGRLYVKKVKLGEGEKIETEEVSFEESLESVRCKNTEKRISFSEKFWESYAEAKKAQRINLPINEQSLEQKAIINLNFLIRNPKESIIDHLDFLKTLLEDILDYGTLPDYTLRKIGDIKDEKDVDELEKDLGLDYLQKEKEEQRNYKKEIIIAIENVRI
ncbi:MAG: helicase [Candidatus Moranbacteria bacterium CG23_combo_of_CG06-09_8_20_14_all_35_22]|nr:MAG: helicase [Candidatus Moranbacteria bacterium CG23_combo_of_CG06-09_8_20_14_all_35_22]